MKNEDKIVELLSEMLHKFDTLTDEVIGLKGEVVDLKGEMKEVKTEVQGMNRKLSKVENEIIKLNLISADNARALIKLADDNDRITRLEKAVFK